MTESHDREIIGGHLLVIGGAEDKYNERRILKKFLELAGGTSAEVLIVPVASDYPEFAADVYTQAFRNLGVVNPRVLRATSRQDVVNADVKKLLDGVTGIIMTGGDQMRLVSLLGGTKLAENIRRSGARYGCRFGRDECRCGGDEHLDDRAWRADLASA